MKKIIVLLLSLISITLNATLYYVAPSTSSPAGDDDNVGSIDAPWLTWQKAFSTATAGDTVYFRGGIYPQSVLTGAGTQVTVSGTQANPICFFNYPGEEPILDCSNVPRPASIGWNFGMRFGNNIAYVEIKGLTIRNVFQNDDGGNCNGIFIDNVSYLKFENIKIHDIEGPCVITSNYDKVWFKNCDAWNSCDSHTIGNEGRNGTGFGSNNRVSVAGERAYTSELYYEGCRTWKFSDNGITYSNSPGYIEIKNCWAFDGGLLNGEGCGFKGGFDTDTQTLSLTRVIINCIAAYNGHYGFSENTNTSYDTYKMHCYNNTSYHNGYKFVENHPTWGYGFWVPYHRTSDYQNWYRNNLAYDNGSSLSENLFQGSYFHEYNSWESPPPATITDADFLSIDSTGLSGSRQADGSLPVLNFLKLTSTSDLKDAGVDVGLSYYGVAPDIGFNEYVPENPPVEPTIIYATGVYPSVKYALVSGNVTSDGGGTVSARGVAYGVSLNPTITGNHTHDGSGTGTFISNITGLNKNTTYHVRAYATNEAGTAYGADVQFTTKKASNATHGGKPLFNGSKIMTIQ